MDRKKIMVVDDNALVCKLVNSYLMERGYDVVICDGPFGVLNTFRKHTPDAVLMDLNMPGLSGHRLAELVNRSRAGSDCRLLIFSSEDESVQSELVSKGHADGYFSKRGSIEGLDKKLEEMLSVREECLSSGR